MTCSGFVRVHLAVMLLAGACGGDVAAPPSPPRDSPAGSRHSHVDLGAFPAVGDIGPGGGAVSLTDGPTITVPAGAFREDGRIGVRVAEAAPTLPAGTTGLTPWFEVALTLNDVSATPAAPIAIEVPVTVPDEAIAHPGLRLVVEVGGALVPLDAVFDTARGLLVTRVLGLPPRARLAACFTPSIRRAGADTPALAFATWSTTEWVIDYDGQLIDQTEAEGLLAAAREVSARYSAAGLKEPFLYKETSRGHALWHLHLAGSGSHFDSMARPDDPDEALRFGRLYLNVSRLDATGDDPIGTIVDDLAHELFHAVFRSYEIPTTCWDYESDGATWCYPSDSGFNEGLATAVGYWVDRGELVPRPDLSRMLLTAPFGYFDVADRAAAYRNQDFYLYLLRKGGLEAARVHLETLATTSSLASVGTKYEALALYSQALASAPTGLDSWTFNELFGRYVGERAYIRPLDAWIWTTEPEGLGQPGAEYVLDPGLVEEGAVRVREADCTPSTTRATCRVKLGAVPPLAARLVTIEDVPSLGAAWPFPPVDGEVSASASPGSAGLWAFGDADGVGTFEGTSFSPLGRRAVIADVVLEHPRVLTLVWQHGAAEAEIAVEAVFGSEEPMAWRYAGTGVYTQIHDDAQGTRLECPQDAPMTAVVDREARTILVHVDYVEVGMAEGECTLMPTSSWKEYRTTTYDEDGGFSLVNRDNEDFPPYVHGSFDRDRIQGSGVSDGGISGEDGHFAEAVSFTLDRVWD